MNRRYFLGLALSTMVAPAFAKNNNDKARFLSLKQLHTDERIRVAYRIGDNYQRDALDKLNLFLRDHRTNQTTYMDPKLLDLLYDLQNHIHGEECEIEVFSAYRSPSSNATLRKTSRGVARNSFHIIGQAIDVTFEGCSNACLRESAIALSRGGVGSYGRSGFVHLDTGPVRVWRA